MFTRSALIGCAVVVAVLLAGVSQAAVTMGSPYNIAGTGTVTGSDNGSGGTYANWTSGNTRTSHFQSAPSANVLWREETWAVAQTVGAFLFDATDRAFGGDIWVDMIGDGSYTLVTSFVVDSPNTTKLVDVSDILGSKGVYGVKVVINKSDGEIRDIGAAANYYQIGEMAILSAPIENVALGATTIYTPGSQRTSSVTDMSMSTSWRAAAGATENWVGILWDEAVQVDGLRVTAATDHVMYTWEDYFVQVTYDGVNWVPVLDGEGEPFQAHYSMTNWTPWNLCWIDFGQTLTVMGVRLYGGSELDDEGYVIGDGNNPGPRNGGLIVGDILAYRVVPEPATMSLLALGGLAMLRRRR
ncbi:MAG: PEP-CTERM sorting domain-containing protein [Phycisphaerae bacterium]|nr:PEP-CTERM sorting domain-containing protein [Phycisphaerae bacterium]